MFTLGKEAGARPSKIQIAFANDAGRARIEAQRVCRESPPSPDREFETSRKIPEQVFGQRTTSHRRGPARRAISRRRTAARIALGIRHVLCVPLRLVHYVDTPGAPGEARAIGVLYLDSREQGKAALDAARAALETLAAEASVAIENARLYREATEKARMDEELRIASQIQQRSFRSAKDCRILRGPSDDSHGQTAATCRGHRIPRK